VNVDDKSVFFYIGAISFNRNGDQRLAGNRDPVDYLFTRQAEPSISMTQPQSSLDNLPLPPTGLTADFYPTKLHAEPGSRLRPVYAQDDHQRMYVKVLWISVY